MNIGEEVRELTVEPVEWPAPSPQPHETPAPPVPQSVPEPVPHDE